MPNDSRLIAALFATTTLRRPEDAIGFLLWRVAHRYQREVDRAFADIGLTHLQFATLVMTAWLSRSGAAVMQPELATFSQIHPMQLSNVLKALEEKQLIARFRSGSDGRKKQVELTRPGIAALQRALPLVETAQRQFFNLDHEAGKRMHAALRRIVEGWAGDE